MDSTIARRPSKLRFYAYAYLIFLYAPVLLLPVFSFNNSPIISFPLKGFTLHWFYVLTANQTLLIALKNSLYIASATALISTMLGVLAARALSRGVLFGQRPITGFVMLPLFLPEIIIAVSILVVLLQLGFNLSLWSVVLGHVLICIPFSIVVLLSAFRGLDQSLEEASMDLGVGRMQTFLRVTLPLVLPGIVSSLLITFTLSLDEFIIAFFLTGTEPTLPVYIWSQLRFPAKLPSIMALGTILLLFSLIMLLLAERFRRRSAARTGTASAPTGMI